MTSLNDVLAAALVSIAIFLGFYLAGVICQRLIKRYAPKSNRASAAVIALLGRSIKAVFIIIGIICALGTIGVDVSALVAGLGLTGFAVGFALKDSISNLLAGILILMYKQARMSYF